MLPMDSDKANGRLSLDAGVKTVAMEIDALNLLRLALLKPPLCQGFVEAAKTIAGVQGRVIVTGMGKSGLIGRKIAATLASTGTPAFFLHPADASHGDLGTITKNDIVFALSWSGETEELSDVIRYCGRFKVQLIAASSQGKSNLAQRADISLVLPEVEEACPNRLAPTSSTAVQAALGDALAVALIQVRGFSPSDFHVFHPGGRLGAQLLRVADLMAVGNDIPRVQADVTILSAMLEMSSKRFGITGIVDLTEQHIIGAFTDGDLRRSLTVTTIESLVGDFMTPYPLTVDAELLASEALELMNSRNVMQLFVTSNNKLAGIIHVHDILRAGVV